jgi:hypothetical protein
MSEQTFKYKKAEFQAKLGIDDQEEFQSILRSCGLHTQSKFTDDNLSLARDFAKKLFEVKQSQQQKEKENFKADAPVPDKKDDLLHCFKCKEYKPKKEFYINKKLSRGYESYCKECKKANTKKQATKKAGIKSTTNNNIMPNANKTTQPTNSKTFTISKEELIEFGKKCFANGVEKAKKDLQMEKAPIDDILSEVCQ